MEVDEHGFPVCPGQDGPVFRKFIARVDGGDWAADRCWLWTGSRSPKGYGVFAPRKKTIHRAHRYAMLAYLGRLPKQLVLHRCDNPPCVNPMHLMEGDHGANMRQMADRKRATREERHHKAKLTVHEALAIRVLHRSGDYTVTELGTMFNVSKATATAVAAGKRWPDVCKLADAMLKARGTGEDGHQ